MYSAKKYLNSNPHSVFIFCEIYCKLLSLLSIDGKCENKIKPNKKSQQNPLMIGMGLTKTFYSK